MAISEFDFVKEFKSKVKKAQRFTGKLKSAIDVLSERWSLPKPDKFLSAVLFIRGGEDGHLCIHVQDVFEIDDLNHIHNNLVGDILYKKKIEPYNNLLMGGYLLVVGTELYLVVVRENFKLVCEEMKNEDYQEYGIKEIIVLNKTDVSLMGCDFIEFVRALAWNRFCDEKGLSLRDRSVLSGTLRDRGESNNVCGWEGIYQEIFGSYRKIE